MKQKTYNQLLLALSILGSGTLAFAQGPAAPAAAPTPFMDPHPYQSQTTIRSTAAGLESGMIQVLPSVIVGEYKFRVPGVQVLQSAFNTALLYDTRNPLSATTNAGGNFAFYESTTPGTSYLSTVNANGSFFYKGLQTFKPGVVGGVYFTDKTTNNLVVVDSFGFFWNTFTAAPAIRLAGGNFFIDQTGTLTTMKSMGVAPGDATGMVTVKTGVSFADAEKVGGNYFVKRDGTVITVSSITGYYSAPYTPDARPVILGGNWFVGADKLLYTIDSDGNLKKDTDYTVSTAPADIASMTIGYSFIRMRDGSFIFVDGVGIAHKTILRISTTGTNVDQLTKLPATIDARNLYLPKNL